MLLIMFWFRKRRSSWWNVSTNADSRKKSGVEELSGWAGKLVKRTADALFHTLVFLGEWGMWIGTLVHEKLWSEDSKIRESRKNLREHYFQQSWKSFKEARKWLWDALVWGFHTWKWAARAFYESWKETVKSLRKGNDVNNTGDVDNNTSVNSKSGSKTSGKTSGKTSSKTSSKASGKASGKTNSKTTSKTSSKTSSRTSSKVSK